MNTHSTISIPFHQKNEKKSNKKSIRAQIATYVEQWKFDFSSLKINSRGVYYVDENGYDQTKKIAKDLASLTSIKSNWSSADTVRLRRGGIYTDTGVYQQLVDAGVFIEAYGHGAAPIIKSDNVHIEIGDTAWM